MLLDPVMMEITASSNFTKKIRPQNSISIRGLNKGTTGRIYKVQGFAWERRWILFHSPLTEIEHLSVWDVGTRTQKHCQDQWLGQQKRPVMFIYLWCLSGKESACNVGDVGSILGREDPLEEEMATHCSIPAWEISWTEEPGGRQSVGSPKGGTQPHSHPSYLPSFI